MSKINLKTKEVRTLVSSLLGAIALTYHNNRYYIGIWNNGTVYMFNDN